MFNERHRSTIIIIFFYPPPPSPPPSLFAETNEQRKNKRSPRSRMLEDTWKKIEAYWSLCLERDVELLSTRFTRWTQTTPLFFLAAPPPYIFQSSSCRQGTVRKISCIERGACVRPNGITREALQRRRIRTFPTFQQRVGTRCTSTYTQVVVAWVGGVERDRPSSFSLQFR